MNIWIVWGLLWRCPFWIGMIFLNLILQLLGFPLIALALLCRATDPAQKSWEYPGEILSTWKWKWLRWLWGNEEDGIDGLGLNVEGKIKNLNWATRAVLWSYFKTVFIWSAWRNSVNNLRFTWLGRSPNYIGADTMPKDGLVFITKGIKFFFQVPLNNTDPYYILWLGWKPGFGVGFKSTITSLEKQGA